MSSSPSRVPSEQRAPPRKPSAVGRLGQAELGGQGERLLGGRDRLSVFAADEVHPGQLA